MLAPRRRCKGEAGFGTKEMMQRCLTDLHVSPLWFRRALSNSPACHLFGSARGGARGGAGRRCWPRAAAACYVRGGTCMSSLWFRRGVVQRVRCSGADRGGGQSARRPAPPAPCPPPPLRRSPPPSQPPPEAPSSPAVHTTHRRSCWSRAEGGRGGSVCAGGRTVSLVAGERLLLLLLGRRRLPGSS